MTPNFDFDINDALAFDVEGYRLIEVIGRGGMGVVYKAEQEVLHRIVALKHLYVRHSENPDLIDQFLREGRNIARMPHHPGIVQIHTIVQSENGDPCIVMEYIDGHSLADVLREQRSLSTNTAVQIISQAARALNHAHNHRVIHRDIKPGNIMITREGGVKLLDFGLAHHQGTLFGVKAKNQFGTPQYMSPETVMGEAAIDGRADIYSLSVVLFLLVTGHLPFADPQPARVAMHHLHTPPPRPSRIYAQTPPELDYIILRGLIKNPEERYQTADEFADDLDEFFARQTGVFSGSEINSKLENGDVFATSFNNRNEFSASTEPFSLKNGNVDEQRDGVDKGQSVEEGRMTSSSNADEVILDSSTSEPLSSTDDFDIEPKKRRAIFLAIAAIILGGGLIAASLFLESRGGQTEIQSSDATTTGLGDSPQGYDRPSLPSPGDQVVSLPAITPGVPRQVSVEMTPSPLTAGNRQTPGSRNPVTSLSDENIVLPPTPGHRTATTANNPGSFYPPGASYPKGASTRTAWLSEVTQANVGKTFMVRGRIHRITPSASADAPLRIWAQEVYQDENPTSVQGRPLQGFRQRVQDSNAHFLEIPIVVWPKTLSRFSDEQTFKIGDIIAVTGRIDEYRGEVRVTLATPQNFAILGH